MTASRCPRCRAANPGDAAWCSLCYADLRSADLRPADLRPAPERAEPVAVPAQPGAAAQRTSQAADDGEPAGWPCSACGALAELAADSCPSCGTGFLAVLTEPAWDSGIGGTGLPFADRLLAMSRGRRIGVLAAVALALTVGLTAVAALLGLAL